MQKMEEILEKEVESLSDDALDEVAGGAARREAHCPKCGFQECFILPSSSKMCCSNCGYKGLFGEWLG